jgi:hypothetical protein
VVGEGEKAVTKEAKRLPALKQQMADTAPLGESRQPTMGA